jgi:hypothetical protein
MLPGFEKIVEERIKRGQKQGLFDNLEGTGRPLELEEDRGIPEDLRMAYKILKNAECLPPEIELKKEIFQTEQLLTAVEDVAEQYRLTKRLNFLVLKLNTLRSTPLALEADQRYLGKITERLGARQKP